MHYENIFLSACVITWVAFQRCFLQLFVISIEVRSQSILFDTYVLASVTIKCYVIHTLLYWCLCRCILKVTLLEHLYSHLLHWNSWSFWFSNGLLWFLKLYHCKFSFFVDLYSHWVHSCWSSVSISTFTWSYNKVRLASPLVPMAP